MTPRKRNPKQIWIIGGGFMGQGIAQLCAQYNMRISLIDISNTALEKASESIKWSLDKLYAKKLLMESPEKVLMRINFLNIPQKNEKADLLIECLPEDINTKKKALEIYDELCPPETIFASNTSSIPIGLLANFTTRPENFIGTHFASPPVMQKLVEVIPALTTSSAVIQYVKNFLLKLDREIIEVRVDIAGFIMNRIYLAAAAEAIRLLERGAAPAFDIDRAMQIGFGWSKGPLEAADLAGLDIILNAMQTIWEESGNLAYNPPDLLRRLVEAKHLGRKTGEGFYNYSS
jgi:3-hydroxybutyryl-CoA dehydrogenase